MPMFHVRNSFWPSDQREGRVTNMSEALLMQSAGFGGSTTNLKMATSYTYTDRNGNWYSASLSLSAPGSFACGVSSWVNNSQYGCSCGNGYTPIMSSGQSSNYTALWVWSSNSSSISNIVGSREFSGYWASYNGTTFTFGQLTNFSQLMTVVVYI